MARWMIAMVVAGGVALVGVPVGRRRAFRAGWFERSSQTRRRRGERRPTHGGLVLALAIGGGAAIGGPSQPAVRAVIAAVAVAVVSGASVERGRGASWWPTAGRVAASAVVPLAGVRAELTGGLRTDQVLTGLLVLATVGGLRSLGRSGGTAPVVAAISGAACLAVAAGTGSAGAPVAAALVGASLAMAAHTRSPGVVRIGTVGPTVLGVTLAVAAIEIEPAVGAPRSLLVPVLALGTVGAALVVPDWAGRLRRRGWPPRLVLPAATVAGALAAERLAAGALEVGPAVGLGLGPVLVLAGLGAATSRPRQRRDRWRWWVLAAALVTVVLGAVAARSIAVARGDMEDGRDLATAGLDAARAGDLERAQRLFATADIAFAGARSALGNPAVRLGAVVPGLAQNLRSARMLAEVGGDLSSTAVAVAERAGADDLVVEDGRFPLDAARQVSAELAPAVATLRRASIRLDDTASPLLLREVREGVAVVGERIAAATDSIEVAAEATRLAPGLLGADGDRRWLLAVLTPSEQRGAGGLAGDYAELAAREGDIDLVRSLPAAELNAASDPAVQARVLPDVYATRYGGMRPGRFWQNLSATPDVPTFASAVAAAFPRTRGGGAVDGVVVLDPYAVAALLELTGPISVPAWPEPLTAGNAASVLLFDHYDRLTPAQIDGFQSEVIDALVEALTSGPLPPISQLAAVLGPQVAGGHLRLWSPEAAPQALFERIGADGGLGVRAQGADFVQLVTQNDGENKIDWFLRRSLAYRATVDPGTGAVRATATVTLANTAPDAGVASYVIGEPDGPTRPGENELTATVFSPHRPVGVTDASGQRLPVNLGREQGLHAVSVVLELPAGATTAFTITFEGVLPSLVGAPYQLVVGRQPAVVPDSIDARVVPALGWSLLPGDRDRVRGRDDRRLTLHGWFQR